MMDIDSPAASNNIFNTHRRLTAQPNIKFSSSSSAIPQHHPINTNNHDLSDSSEIIESPSILPKGTLKTKGKSRPDLLQIKTSSFKRPASPSLSIDSPTTTLAADLSQNFHIEKNNQNKVPTPKRSLFAKSMNSGSASLDIEDIENAMDVSPLITREKSLQRSDSSAFPFRKPFANLATSRGSSTSSLMTSSSISTVSSTTSSASSSLNLSNASFHIFNDNNSACQLNASKTATQPSNPMQRRAVRRAYSSNAFSNRNATMINGSLFQPSLNHMSEDNLDSFCVASPIQEKLTPSTESMINLADRRDFNIDAGSGSENDDSPSLNRDVGSPIQQRITSKVKAARSKVRRTHSMFQNPADYLTNEKNATSAINKISTNMTALSFDNDHTSTGNATLPFTDIKTTMDNKNLIPRIHVDEFVKILDGAYAEYFNKVIVVDCRFEYEFKGGHIDGAINISSQSDLENEFLSEDKVTQEPLQNKTLVIFHCEFSSYRGPLMANHLRKSDRLMNTDNYPNLYYPDILILEGGYKNFFDSQSHRCYPKCYVAMNDLKHADTCEIQMHRIRRDSKLQHSRSLKKAKSFHVSLPNSHSLHARSRSQTIFQLASASTSTINTNPHPSSSSSSSIPTAANSSSRPSSITRARHSSSLFSLSKHHSMKFNQRSSTNSLLSNTTNTTAESDEDQESDVLGSYFSNRDSDGITSFFDNQASSSNTLSSFLEDSHSSTDFKFPAKFKSNSLHQVLSVSANTTARLTDLAKAHQDTPIISHKKQKSSGHLYRAMTQPNLEH